MEVSIQKQLINLLYSSLLGLIFGAEYDIIRIVHTVLRECRFPNWLRGGILFLLDLSYMLTLTVSCSLFMYACNHGAWRLFLLLPMGVGFLVYHHTWGRIVMAFTDRIIRFVRFLLRYTVVLPIKFLLRTLRTIFSFLGRYTLVPMAEGISRGIAALRGTMVTRRIRRRLLESIQREFKGIDYGKERE